MLYLCKSGHKYVLQLLIIGWVIVQFYTYYNLKQPIKSHINIYLTYIDDGDSDGDGDGDGDEAVHSTIDGKQYFDFEIFKEVKNAVCILESPLE